MHWSDFSNDYIFKWKKKKSSARPCVPMIQKMWSLHPRGLLWSLRFHDSFPNWLLAPPGERICLNKYVRIPRLLKLWWEKNPEVWRKWKQNQQKKIFFFLQSSQIQNHSSLYQKNVLSQFGLGSRLAQVSMIAYSRKNSGMDRKLPFSLVCQVLMG